MDDDELHDLFHEGVSDDSGTIDYEQFIAAMLDSNRLARRKDAVRTSFEQLDMDGDGFITVDDLCKLLPSSRRSMDLARSMVEEVDKNHDGRVDYQEFSEMMNTPEPSVSSSVHVLPHGGGALGARSRRNSSTCGTDGNRPSSLLRVGPRVGSSFGSSTSNVASAAANGNHAAVPAVAEAAVATAPAAVASAAAGSKGASSQVGGTLQPAGLTGGDLVPVA